MDLYSVLSISCGGFLGSILRYSISEYSSRKIGGPLAWGTIFINIAGSFFLGCVISLNSLLVINRYLYLFLAAGFAGAFTTFSTAMYELHRLMEDGEISKASVYSIISMAGGIASAVVGFYLVQRMLV